MNFICFDLEGPLSPQDNAYELMKLIPNGDRIFEVISRYDDLVALSGKKNYEPGDTLSLIIPFLLHAKLPPQQMIAVSNKATLIDGAKEFIAELKFRGWWIGDITTCYRHYGHPITERLGIPNKNVACTKFPLLDYYGTNLSEADLYYKTMLSEADLSMVGDVENEIVTLEPYKHDDMIADRLDLFFNKQLAGTTLGNIMKTVKPLGGRRKVKQLRQFARQNGFKLSEGVCVGDSITDSKMLEAVKKEGGIAVAFNANKYALRYANVGLASTNLGDLRLVTQAWEKGRKEAVEKAVKEKETEGGIGHRCHFHWLSGRKDIDEVIEIHKRIRNLIREEAGKLG